MIIQRTLDTYCGLYDFDVTGGVVGSYDLQIPIPANSTPMEFGAQVVTGATSGTSTATISFDAISINFSPVTTAIGFFLPATIVTSFATPANVVMGITPTVAGVNGVPVSLQFQTLSIGMSIAVEDLLTGKIIVFCRCISFDFS